MWTKVLGYSKRLLGVGFSKRADKAPRAKPRVRSMEFRVRDKLASSIPGAKTEVHCSSGIIDILTPTEVIEVKRASMWKAAMGQVLAYGEDFPEHSKRIHLFSHEKQHYRLAVVTCERFGVKVTHAEDPKDESQKT